MQTARATDKFPHDVRFACEAPLRTMENDAVVQLVRHK